jgi:hypothetical protein
MKNIQPLLDSLNQTRENIQNDIDKGLNEIIETIKGFYMAQEIMKGKK